MTRITVAEASCAKLLKLLCKVNCRCWSYSKIITKFKLSSCYRNSPRPGPRHPPGCRQAPAPPAATTRASSCTRPVLQLVPGPRGWRWRRSSGASCVQATTTTLVSRHHQRAWTSLCPWAARGLDDDPGRDPPHGKLLEEPPQICYTTTSLLH